VKETKRHLGWPEDKQFYVPDEALAHFEKRSNGARSRSANGKVSRAISGAARELAISGRQTMSGELPPDWETHLPDFADAKPVATRVASGSGD